MSVFWVAFLGSSFLIYFFLTPATDTFEKLSIEVLFKYFIAKVLEWFAYFNMTLKSDKKYYQLREPPHETRNFQLITALEKNLLKISTIFKSSLTISSLMLPSVCLFYQSCFFGQFDFTWRERFYSSAKLLIISKIFFIQVRIVVSFCFS